MRAAPRSSWRPLWIGALSLSLLACADTPPLDPPPDPPPNIIFILVDTLRVDAMGAFGGSGDAMPFIDGLADRAYVFEDAISSSPWTGPSVASLFTSRHQSQHGITTFSSLLRPEEVTLAEILAERGYATGGFSANWLIRGKAGYGQGFDHFVANRGRGPRFRRRTEAAQKTSRRALDWIDGLSTDSPQPVHVYLHLMDPHTPYNPTAEAMDWAFGGQPHVGPRQINKALYGETKPAEAMDWAFGGQPHVGPRQINKALYGETKQTMGAMRAGMKAAIQKAYRAEVRDVDDALRTFFAGLEERGLLANSLIVFVADHGEEFWDHGQLGHNHSLYDELIHVPLMIHFPGQQERIDVRETISLVDLAPTLLDWLGAPSEPRFSGQSLWPALSHYPAPGIERWFHSLMGRESISAPAISEHLQAPALRTGLPHERAVVLGRHKLIANADGEKHFFERNALLEEVPAQDVDASLRARLEAALEGFLREVGPPTKAPEHEMSDETRDELQALGYIE